jgi:hypothetical protein
VHLLFCTKSLIPSSKFQVTLGRTWGHPFLPIHIGSAGERARPPVQSFFVPGQMNRTEPNPPNFRTEPPDRTFRDSSHRQHKREPKPEHATKLTSIILNTRIHICQYELVLSVMATTTVNGYYLTSTIRKHAQPSTTVGKQCSDNGSNDDSTAHRVHCSTVTTPIKVPIVSRPTTATITITRQHSPRPTSTDQKLSLTSTRQHSTRPPHQLIRNCH